MITITKIGPGAHSITINCREPRIYLDHWAIRRISEDPARKARFLTGLTVTDGLKLDNTHMRDVYHACCAVRCADMVTVGTGPNR